MTLEEYKITTHFPLPQATILFLVTEDKILLALTKRGFSQGKWNGVGGKVGKDESPAEAAVRETMEEIGVTPKQVCEVGKIDFFYPAVRPEKNWDQQILLFTSSEWEGTPTETEEMAPKWYSKKRLPFKKMWADDSYWLPVILKGKYAEGEFLIDGNTILDFLLTEKDFED